MFFKIKNKKYLSAEYLRSTTLISAYKVIKNYKLYATDVLMDNHIQQQYKMPLKNMCIELLLNLTFYEDNSGNLVLLFKDSRHDKIARLITYGNGAIPGSRILQIALKD